MNPLLNMLSTSNPMISQFMEFMHNFKGDPKAEIDNLLKSGKVTQAQYDDALAKAKQLEPMIRKMIR